MAAKKKRRRTPSVSIPVAKRAGSSVGALAALDQAAPPSDPAGDDAGVVLPSSTSQPLSGSTVAAGDETTATPAAATPATPAGSKPPKVAAKGVSLTGNAFNGLNRDQLRTMTAHQANEIADLKSQLRRQDRAAAEPLLKPEDLQEALGETFGLIGELAAMKFGDDVQLLEDERERLGRVWSTPLAKIVEKFTETDPANASLITSVLIAAGCTGGIVMRKARAVKRRRDAAAQRA